MGNNVIIVISLIATGYFYLSKRFEAALITLFSLCMIAPTLIIGEARLNAAYLITIWLAGLYLIETIRDKTFPKLNRQEIKTLLLVFIVSRIITIAAYIIGYLQNGTAGWGVVAGALGGNINLSILVVELVFMGQKVAKNRLLPVMYKTAVILAGINLIFFFLQRFAFDIAYPLTEELFMSPDRSAPLLNMKEIGSFDRIFGTFFTPTVLGTTFLYLIVIMAAWYFMTKQKQIPGPVIAVSTILLFIGINSFSKLIVLGIPVMLGFFFIALLFMRRSTSIRKISFKNYWVFAALCVAVFIATYYLFPAELINVKKYYYGLLIKPLASLSTRYKAPEPVSPGIIESGEQSMDVGMTVGAFMFFKRFPIFGVGPVAIADEFIGDSQVVSALHDGGIVGAAGYLLFYGYAYIQGIKKRNLMVISLITALAIGCLASITLGYRNTMPFIAFIILIATDTDLAFGPDPDEKRLSWSGSELSL